MELDDSQREAVEMMRRTRFGIMTGPPGSGKTHTLKAAIQQADEDGESYRLCAPTGKAARRMAQLTEREACTIHRLLGWTREGFIHNEDHPLPESVVFVDEASMIDYPLACSLFAGACQSRIMLIGDADQLPPVGPGRMFGDLVDLGGVPVARLRRQHRAGSGSWVMRNAPLIMLGEMPALTNEPTFERIEVPDAKQIADAVFAAVARDLTATVLAPQYAGAAGCDSLNAGLDLLLNEASRVPKTGEPRVGKLVRLGMRVIQTQNNYGLDVMNGEIGVVRSIDGDGGPVEVWFVELGRLVTYARSEAAQLAPAYALTVHKTQGSEFPHVIVVCHSTHSHMLSRSLLYTAVTRASVKVTLVGDDVGLARALKSDAARRETTLVERIRNTLEAVELAP